MLILLFDIDYVSLTLCYLAELFGILEGAILLAQKYLCLTLWTKSRFHAEREFQFYFF